MDGDADADDIVWAAKTAGVHDFILSLPNAYDTEIGDGGSSLSGGQRQRIGLARAIYGRPKLLVLDEPHASLDGQGEADLMQAVEAAKDWGATVILVAHRPAILRPADRLVVIHDGRVVMEGERADILRRLQQPATLAHPNVAAGPGALAVEPPAPAGAAAVDYRSEDTEAANAGPEVSSSPVQTEEAGGARERTEAPGDDGKVAKPETFKAAAAGVLARAAAPQKGRNRALERLRARRKEASA